MANTYDAKGIHGKELLDFGTEIAKKIRTDDEVIAASLNNLNSRLEAFENIENWGDILADSINTSEFPLVAGKPMVVVKAGTPSGTSTIPDYAGQFYVDSTNKVIYCSGGYSSVNDWVDVTNKIGTGTVGSATKPIYLNSGTPTAGSDYAGGTKVTLNGTDKGASTATIYAPTTAGTNNYVLKSNGSGEPSWVEKAPKASAADTATTATDYNTSSGTIKSGLDSKVNIANISLDGYSGTILDKIKALQSSGIDYARFATSSNAGAANITDKPLSSSGFLLEAKRHRKASATDWAYQLQLWVQLDTNPYVAIVTNNTTSISWSWLDAKVKVTAKTDNVNYKILATASASPTSGGVTEAVYDADITLNPSTNTIAANISGDAATASAAKSGSTLATTIAGKQDALSAQTPYSAKGTATKVPQITTNSLGQVTKIEEVTITGVAPASHTHGNITNAGAIGTTSGNAVYTTTNGVLTAGSLATDDPTASGTTTTAIATISQDAKGKITVTKKTISGVTPASHTHGNITNAGALQTNDVTIASGDKLVITDSSDSSKVARASISFDGSTTTTALTPKGTFEAFAKSGDITSAINALDVSSVGGDGKYISAISETDGKISATATSMDTAPTASSTKAVTSGGIKTALDAKANGVRWTAVTKGQTWSRLFYSAPVNSVEGSNGILAVSCTRGNVVCNATFLITASHNGANHSTIIELASCNYTQVRSRLVVSANGNYYFEIYDTANSITSSRTQPWHCSFVPLLEATITTYTAFTDGTTVPTDYTATNDFTTTGGHSASAIKNITRDGTTFTATRQDGSTFTFTQQDSNTDTLVKATAKTDNVNYKILATASSSPTSGAATEAVYDTDITLNPSTNTITANISGNAATATSATSATTATSATSAGKLSSAKKLAVNLANTSTDTTFDGSADQTGIKVSGTLPVANGGTGLTASPSMLTNLGSTSAANVFAASPRPGVTGTLPVANGGTGATTAANARTNLSVYSKAEVDSMLTGRISIVTSLPATGEAGVIYFVGPTGSGSDKYEEYVWDGSAFVKVGEKSLDLSNYVNTLTTTGSGNAITAISKSGNTITATVGNVTFTQPQLGQGYGTCGTAEATAAKTVTLSDFVLKNGGIVAVKFTYALCASATLNVNSTGAKPVLIAGAAPTSSTCKAVQANDIAYFIYDGTSYHFLGTERASRSSITNITRSGTTFTATRADGSTFTFTQQDNNTTYTQETLGQGYGTCTTAEATAAKAVSLSNYELVTNGIIAVKFSYGLCASATLNVNNKGAKPIYIHGAAVSSTTAKEVLAGDIALFMYDGSQYQFLCSDRLSKDAITGLSVSGKTITYTKADGTTGTLTTQDTTYTFDGTYDSSTNKAATVSTVTNKIAALDVSDISGFGAGKTLATLTETDGKIAATFQNISITKSQVSDFPSSMTPTSHASSATTYGIGTTANYGHVKLATGDMNGAAHADGVAVSKNHTHSQYQTVLTEMTTQEVDDLLAVLT